MGGTPWHAHHIAERYGLLTIIALGEGVVGTVASLSAVGRRTGLDRATPSSSRSQASGSRSACGGCTSSCRSRDLLHAHRERSFLFGYLHIVLFGAIVATGAGLHAAAYYIEHHSKLGSVGTVLSVAIPVGGLHRVGLPALRMVGADGGRVPPAARWR